jgi:hypothetical protein
VTSGRCSDLSEAAGESLAATATNAVDWLLVEAPGAWPRDVSEDDALDARTRAAISAWQDERPYSKLLFIRRPGRAPARRAVFVVTASETRRVVRRIDVEDGRALTDVDLASDGVVVDRQLVLVCGHGTRDACCAVRGRAVFGALETQLAPSDLWLSSHQGGHRFAANVLVLPAGIHLGRVAAGDAARVVGDALEGRIALEHYRGRTAYTARQQAAEWVVRESKELVGVSDLRLAAERGDQVAFVDRSGEEHRAVTEDVAGPLIPASCGARPEPQSHVAARLL